MSLGVRHSMPPVLSPRPFTAPAVDGASGAQEDSNAKQHTRAEKLRMEKGYFHEMLELQKTNGKPFIAEDKLVDVDSAAIFPALTGETLGGAAAELELPASLQAKNGTTKVSLVALSFKQFGFEQLDSWIHPFLQAAQEAQGTSAAEPAQYPQKIRKGTRGRRASESFQVMQLSALEGGFIANLLKGSMKGGLAKAIPPERHATALVFVGDVDPLCDGLAITNRLIGHAFLVDSAGRVRWRACGVATELEEQRLRACVEMLLNNEQNAITTAEIS